MFSTYSSLPPFLEDSNAGESGNYEEAFVKQFQNAITPFLVIGLFLYSFSFGPREQKQVNIILDYA